MPDSKERFDRTKATRRGHRSVLTRYLNEASRMMKFDITSHDETSTTMTEDVNNKIQLLNTTIEEKLSTITALDDEILNMCAVDDIEKEIEEADDIKTRALMTIQDIQTHIRRSIKPMTSDVNKSPTITQSSPSIHSTPPSTPPSQQIDTTDRNSIVGTVISNSHETQMQVVQDEINGLDLGLQQTENTASANPPTHGTIRPKLPKITLQRFDGEITKFRAFWDSFDSAVNKNTAISPIDKFNYLQGLLEGDASRAIRGLALTQHNYQSALEILQERFGNPQHIISSHMDSLMKLPSCATDCKTSQLRYIYDQVSVNIRGLESLGIKPEQYGSFLIPVIMSKLPTEVKLQIARATNKQVWEIGELLNAIKSEVQARELIDTVKSTHRTTGDDKHYPHSYTKKTSSASALFVRNDVPGDRKWIPICVFCSNQHFSSSCENVSNVKQRRNILSKNKRCFLCLKKGHNSYECSSDKLCRNCQNKHHASVCDKQSNFQRSRGESQQPNTQTKQAPANTSSASTSSNLTNVMTSASRSKCKVLLQTATAYVSSPLDDKTTKARLLFDSGSQRSYVRTQLKSTLNLPTVKSETLNLNTFGSDNCSKKDCDVVEITLNLKNGDIFKIRALSYDTICLPLENKINISPFPHLHDLDLADYRNDTESEAIDILVGSDYYWDLITGDDIRGDSGPVAISSKIGGYFIEILGHRVTWIKDTPDELVETNTFTDHINFNRAIQRYEITLPWKDTCSSLTQATNLNNCISRLYQLKSRLKQDNSLFNEYDKIIRDQLNTGIIEAVNEDVHPSTDTHFLPHHGVVRQDKDTTKLRIVYNGSSKTENGFSLNDCLQTGPNLNPHIFNLLVNFRKQPVGITSDIEKAFHQISIEPEDRKRLRFLWFDDIKKQDPEIIQYQFCRLVFGLTSSPAILNSTIQKHLTNYKDSECEIIERLSQSLYVDDFVGGSNNTLDGLQLYEKSKSILQDGGFNLRKWHTNDSALQKKINDLESQSSQTETLCVTKTDWDTVLDHKLKQWWKLLFQELNILSHVRIPRCYYATNRQPVNQQLHGFSDASETAYAAVVYMRTEYNDGSLDIRLIASKTKVAPLKKQSIPRLELLGANILARLVHNTQESIHRTTTDIQLLPTVLWIDSFTALCWIRNNRPWKQYVQHRITEIHQLTDKGSWRFCPGVENPADIPSRSCKAQELLHNTKWWEGPPFLKQSAEHWPDLPTTFENDLAEEELKKTPKPITISLSTVNHHNSPVNLDLIIDISRFSSKLKLLRVTSLVIKFISLLRHPAATDKSISASDIQNAETEWIKTIQRKTFNSDFENLQNGNKTTTYIKQFGLYLDGDKVIRSRGRINNANIPDHAKTPILLPPNHRFIELLISERHYQVHHNGVRDTLNAVRTTHWILKGRSAVKKFIRRCVVCKRFEGKPYTPPLMPDLPECRVSDEPPFANTGIDFAGPLLVQTSDNVTLKSYVCLFTCASTRAVHLELVQDLSVKSFMEAFRRFSSRRGLPSKLLSDNAKTFIKAASEIKKIIRSPEIQRFLTNKQIQWTFIIEKAPWWGGFWERLVKSVKRCLKKSIGRSSLNFEELRTLLVEIETTLNNRPISFVYDDENGISYPLTPSDMIYGRRISVSPSDRHFEVSSTYNCLTKRVKYHFRLLDNFAKMWRNDYLLSLREHSSKQKPNAQHGSNITVGDIVIIKDDHSARCLWKLAKVVELFHGNDHFVRAALVQVLSTANAKKPIHMRRPIQHLIPLEVFSSDI